MTRKAAKKSKAAMERKAAVEPKSIAKRNPGKRSKAVIVHKAAAKNNPAAKRDSRKKAKAVKGKPTKPTTPPLTSAFVRDGPSEVSGRKAQMTSDLPSTEMRDRVQHLAFLTSADDFGWNCFRSFANGDMGFNNLRTLVLGLDGGHSHPPSMVLFYEELEKHGLVVVLNAKTVTVSYSNWHLRCWDVFDLDELKERVSAHVTGFEELKDLMNPHVVTRESLRSSAPIDVEYNPLRRFGL
ncbi:hypothetical protein CC86DRAFT_456668 [Ophiobolus disseminans]|uniref:Uncharacterized protein n=1 Tax=Ophiobolus disseminans TaxID=1469910 RepID=A0A6A6ZWA3_9PLEO|nr:hypothetical protein CC86DRAFT_456668 [Ophiobolus disseminans]